jgi:hypothetical protein
MSNTFLAKCEQYAELKARVEECDEAAAPLRVEMAKLRDEILAEHGASGLGPSFKLASGATVIFADTMKVKVTDMDAVVAWFKAKGMADMLEYDVKVGSKKLQAVVKEEAGAMREIPAGVEVGQFVQLRMTR